MNVDIIIKNNQNGNAKVIENTMCLDDEKIYGNNLKKLFNKINKKREINKNEGDLIFFILYNNNISLFNILNIFNINQFIRFGIIHNKFGIIKIIKKLLIQFNWKLKIVVDGSKILNKFVVIF